MILLLTHSLDFYTIDGVEQHLAAYGAEYRRLNTDHFPSAFGISVEPGAAMTLQSGEFELDLGQVTSVWARRVWPGQLPEDFPPQAAAASQAQCRNFFHEILGELEKAYWINPWAAGQAAESKLRQLRLAQELGFRVPRTLVTTSPQQVVDFLSQHPEGLITKMLLPTVQSMDGHPDFAYTTRIDKEALEGLEVIRWMPQIFQPYLRRLREYRVIVVAQDFFVGAVQVANPDLVDWRAATDDDGIHWSEASLTPQLQQKVLALVDRLGLVYGALDFLLDEEGQEPYFLEINQAGEWGWLERDLGLPIADRIARALVRQQ